ncbi:hypothetical protein EDB19DRAFT_1768283 [Suillus lakei]|nr:hypothetical protein EDB19DRAFT_1768283 [Suillus lakei]
MKDMSAFTIQFIGIAAAQGFCYYRAFPRDKQLLKILNTTATLLTSFIYWSFFFNCFEAMILLFVTCTLPFIVQRYYADCLVYAVSNKNIYVTIPISVNGRSSSLTDSFSLCLVPIPPTPGAFTSDAMLKVSTAGTFQSISLYFYLRPGRSGVQRIYQCDVATDTRIQSITKNFISMGFLTCLLAISICILYWVGAFAAIGGVTMVFKGSYANSVLAILNARKPLGGPQIMEVELPTITVHNLR